MQTWEIALLGIIGGLIPEVLRAVATMRAGRSPSPLELGASALMGFLGMGVLFFDNSGNGRLQIAVLGASFPQLFSGLVAATTKPDPQVRQRSLRPTRQRNVLDYLAWRLR